MKLAENVFLIVSYKSSAHKKMKIEKLRLGKQDIGCGLVLALTGMESDFFEVTCVVLCFVFLLIRNQQFGRC